MVLDLVSNAFPHSDLITGIRILDKTQKGIENFRVDVWVTFSDDKSEEA